MRQVRECVIACTSILVAKVLTSLSLTAVLKASSFIGRCEAAANNYFAPSIAVLWLYTGRKTYPFTESRREKGYVGFYEEASEACNSSQTAGLFVM